MVISISQMGNLGHRDFGTLSNATQLVQRVGTGFKPKQPGSGSHAFCHCAMLPFPRNARQPIPERITKMKCHFIVTKSHCQGDLLSDMYPSRQVCLQESYQQSPTPHSVYCYTLSEASALRTALTNPLPATQPLRWQGPAGWPRYLCDLNHTAGRLVL